MAPFGAINGISFKGTAKLKSTQALLALLRGENPIASARERMPEVDVTHGCFQAADILDLHRLCIIAHEAMINRKEGKLEPIENANFVENAAQVMFDRLFAQPEFFGNFSIGIAGRDGGHNLQLSRGKAKCAL